MVRLARFFASSKSGSTEADRWNVLTKGDGFLNYSEKFDENITGTDIIRGPGFVRDFFLLPKLPPSVRS